MKRVRVIVIAVIVVAGAAGVYFAARPRGTPLRILYTSRLSGTLGTFDKEGVTYGSAGRIAALVERLRTPNTIVVDNGEFCMPAAEGTEAFGELLTRGMVRAMEAWGVEAANVGFLEQLVGKKAMLALEKEARFPLVSASLVDSETGEYVFEPFTIIERGGLRVAFVGLIDDSTIAGARSEKEEALARGLTPEHRKALEESREVGEGFAVLGLDQALVRVRPLVEGKADIVAVLGSGGSELGAMLSPYSGKGPFDVVLATTSFPTGDTLYAGEIPVLLNGSHGTHLGRVDLVRRKGRPARLASWAPVPVTLDIEPDARFAAIERDVRKSMGGADPLSLVRRRAPPTGMSFLGPEACAKCHQREYDIWAASGHARALSSLKKMDAQYDPRCLVCHVTVIGTEDGYISEEKTPKLASVGCEDCHTRGSQHVTLAGKGKEARFLSTGPNACARCHDKKNSPQFHYRVYWPAVRHEKEKGPEAVSEEATMDPMEAALEGIEWKPAEEKAK